jgi:hypothetical protein
VFLEPGTMDGETVIKNSTQFHLLAAVKLLESLEGKQMVKTYILSL